MTKKPTKITKIKKIIESNKDDIAFVIGNGINRFSNSSNEYLSWDDILKKLWKEVTTKDLKELPKGISYTEFYDILELENSKLNKDINLQEEVVNEMKNWKPDKHHKRIIKKIKQLNAPILTTNFDDTLAQTFEFNLLKTETKGFTDFYPWKTYYGEKELESPISGFGIWHINGMTKYRRSIRLGLRNYMGNVERVRPLLPKTDKDKKDKDFWKNDNTWLQIFFSKNLFIFGLGLEENETFLRWLLIERKKYFNTSNTPEKKGWYICKKSESDSSQGKKLFFESLGFKVIEVDDFADIYKKEIWQ